MPLNTRRASSYPEPPGRSRVPLNPGSSRPAVDSRTSVTLRLPIWSAGPVRPAYEVATGRHPGSDLDSCAPPLPDEDPDEELGCRRAPGRDARGGVRRRRRDRGAASSRCPSSARDDVLVEVSHCGICGTDLHLVLEQYARPGSVLGHEWAGTIAAVGADVARLGDRRARRRRTRRPGAASAARAARGRPSVCLRREPPDHLDFSRGAFCRYKVVAAARLLRVPDGLVDPRRRAHRADRDRDPHRQPRPASTPDDRVLVTGGGPVGLLTTAVLRARGVDDITVSEPAPLRRERALAVGAARVHRARRAAARADGPAGRRAVHARVRVLGQRGARPRRRSTSSTTRARWCSSAPATTCRASTTTA